MKDFYAALNGTRPRDGPRSRSGSAPGLPRAQLTQHQFEFIDARVTRRLGNAPARPRAGSSRRAACGCRGIRVKSDQAKPDPRSLGDRARLGVDSVDDCRVCECEGDANRGVVAGV